MDTTLKRQRIYCTDNIDDLSMGVCTPFCDEAQRIECKIAGTCLLRMCYADEKHIVGVKPFSMNVNAADIEKAVNKWRYNEFLLCRPIDIEIKIGEEK